MKNVLITLVLLASTSSAFAAEMICNINGKIKKISGCSVKPESVNCIQSSFFNSEEIYTFFRLEADGTYEVKEIVSFNTTDLLRRQDVFMPTKTGVKCKVKK
jgi:hypothetical protein